MPISSLLLADVEVSVVTQALVAALLVSLGFSLYLWTSIDRDEKNRHYRFVESNGFTRSQQEFAMSKINRRMSYQRFFDSDGDTSSENDETNSETEGKIESTDSGSWGNGMKYRNTIMHPHFEPSVTSEEASTSKTMLARDPLTTSYESFDDLIESNHNQDNQEGNNSSYRNLCLGEGTTSTRTLAPDRQAAFTGTKSEQVSTSSMDSAPTDQSVENSDNDADQEILRRRIAFRERSAEYDSNCSSAVSLMTNDGDIDVEEESESITVKPKKERASKRRSSIASFSPLIPTALPLSKRSGIRRRRSIDRTTSLHTFEFEKQRPARKQSTRLLQRFNSLRTLGEDSTVESSVDDSTLSSRIETARVQYNSEIMPRKLILIRHGESEGNINQSLFQTKPDSQMNLTKLGWDQATMAGKALRGEILNAEQSGTVHFIVSPYTRTMETFHGLVSAWCDPDETFGHIEDKEERLNMWYKRLREMGITWHEDPRIREQDFGNYQDPQAMLEAKKERHKFGSFYYRFPNGESGADVYDRVSTFLDSLWRSFDVNRSKNFVLVTHGVSIRVLLTRYFRYAIDEFHALQNPQNCEMAILGHDGTGKLQLDGRCNVVTKAKTKDGEIDQEQYGRKKEVEVVGYKFHKKLKTVKYEVLQNKRLIRMSSKGIDVKG